MTAINPKNPQDAVAVQQRVNHSYVYVNFDKVGFHRYPDAPEEVAYLRDIHRHVFEFKVSISVFHDDREIEFHMFKNWLTSLYDGGALQVDYKSCEMLCKDLLDQVLTKYNCAERRVVIEVSEDGECGAVLISEATRPMELSREWLLAQAARLQALDSQGREQA